MARKEEMMEKSDRQMRWEKYVENYAIKNPVKYAMKRATSYIDPLTGREMPKPDELAEVPPSFR
jgi:hypothetical protein